MQQEKEQAAHTVWTQSWCGWHPGRAGFLVSYWDNCLSIWENIQLDLYFTPYRKTLPSGLKTWCICLVCERQNYKTFRCFDLEDPSILPKLWLKTIILSSQLCASISARFAKPQSLVLSQPHLPLSFYRHIYKSCWEMLSIFQCKLLLLETPIHWTLQETHRLPKPCCGAWWPSAEPCNAAKVCPSGEVLR